MVKAWKPLRRRGIPASKRKGALAHMREYLWPSMGLVAYLRWVWLGLLRQADHPHHVALGFALGVVTAFFPLLGTHVILLVVLCWLLGGSVLAGLAGMMVGNPWTYGPIWAANYRIGREILNLPKGQGKAAFHQLVELDWGHMAHDLGVVWHDVLLPTVLGGVILGVPVAAVFYGLVYWQITLWGRRKKVVA